MSGPPSVGIVGGGLAGLAAAVALCEAGFRVELFEAKRQLGGRAGSFTDPATGETIDHCQHVAMGCCTALLDLCRRTNIQHLFRRDEVLHFFSPEGKRYDVQAARWLPAPLHLLPSLLGLGYLSWLDKLCIASGMTRLMLRRAVEDDATIGQWLNQSRQTQRAIDRFWSVILVSALGEEMQQAPLHAARKVFANGFLARRDGYHLYIPTVPLNELYENGIGRWLRDRGVQVHLGQRIQRVVAQDDQAFGLGLPDDTLREFDFTILAVDWQAFPALLSVRILAKLFPDRFTDLSTRWENLIWGSPVTGIHLWFDRPITHLPHAVLVGRLAQWVFARAGSPDGLNPLAKGDMHAQALGAAHYYQVVISASGDLAPRPRHEVIVEVISDLASTFPAVRSAKLLHWRMVTHPSAVFSTVPGMRPLQPTPIRNLFLAGDWTATGWPATMESAVRSGFLAAKAITCDSQRGC
jgi:squalene-associated FAD-dependent desaturase